ncbi:ligase-associated DNA damage response endonuclease PdeM [Marinicauda pacifica]|uniref:ligase-associated DNA damage response endonuclease PdeM n=1 Tax=Marinicauda pacifica TaxID=1133559 RepID=UPI0035C8663F
MSASQAGRISVNGVKLVADLSGVAFEPESASLLVADLHFEKGSALASKGVFLPPYDTRVTLSRLAAAIARYRPRQVIALGDSFHDSQAGQRIHASDAEALTALVTSVDAWVWIEGNHDPAPPPRFGGQVTRQMTLGALTLRHDPLPGERPGEVAGHLHPCAKVRGRAGSVRARCFLSDGSRLIMPAFGAYTGGLNLRDAAYAPCFSTPPDAWVLGRSKVVRVSARRCLPD